MLAMKAYVNVCGVFIFYCLRMGYIILQQVFLVLSNANSGSYQRCPQKFHHELLNVTVPNKSMIMRLMKKFQTIEAVLDKKKNKKLTVLTQKKLDKIGAKKKKS